MKSFLVAPVLTIMGCLLPGMIRAQPFTVSCTGTGGMALGGGGFTGYMAGASTVNNLSQVPVAAFPLSCSFDGFVNGSIVGTHSTSGTINSPITSYSGAFYIANSFEGQDISTIYMHCSYGSINTPSMTGSVNCGIAPFYCDLLESDMFNWDVQIIDCANGLYRIVLADNNAEPGDFTVGTRATTLNYTLTRNGANVGSDLLSSKYVAAPPSFVFDALPSGTYQLSLTASANASPSWNYGGYTLTKTFLLPSAGDCNTNVAVRARLQGASPSGGVMTEGLRSAGLVPVTEPYSGLGYTYVGSSPGATINPTMLNVTGNDAIVDWVIIELRNTATPSQVLRSAPALVQRDGDVVGVDGDPYVSFTVAAGSYHLVVRHRNHLGVMTAAGVAFGTVPKSVDFTDFTTATYGTAALTSDRTLWSGDTSGDGTLKYTGAGNDRDPIILAVGGSTPNNTVNNVYDRRDTNLDGVIKYTGANNDRDIILTNVGSTTPNNTRTQQLP